MKSGGGDGSYWIGLLLEGSQCLHIGLSLPVFETGDSASRLCWYSGHTELQTEQIMLLLLQKIKCSGKGFGGYYRK